MSQGLGERALRVTLRAICFASTVWLTATCDLAQAGETVTKTQAGEPFMEEIIATPQSQRKSWEILYSAYSCVYHQRYALAERWLMYGEVEARGELLSARENPEYLSNAINTVAASRKQAAVPDSSVELLVLRALIQNQFGDRLEALEMMKRTALNNPNHPSIEKLKTKIKTTELELSDNLWMVPPDVEQTGGRKNKLSKWRMDKFPLKVFIATDAAMSKVDGYKAGDSQFLRSGFEIWQKQSGGRLRFVFEPMEAKADIICTWVSDQKTLEIADAIGVCYRAANQNNFLTKAKIKILTFSAKGPLSPSLGLEFRKKLLQEVCIHEIGHSLGLNHSSNENDVMWPFAHSQPINVLTNHDVSAMTSLYLSNVNDTLSAALDAAQSGNYKAAIAPLNKAVSMNLKDSQTRDAICYCLVTTAKAAMVTEDYKVAIDLLIKARSLVTASESKRTRNLVLKNLEYAYLQSGNLKDAEELEKQHGSLKIGKQSSTSFLDQYGLKKDSIPEFEKALTASPNDLAVRERFCFLLVTLAKDEILVKNDAEAISLLTRAKSLLRVGMPKQIIEKVMNALRQEYLDTGRYVEADQTAKDAYALYPPPVVQSVVYKVEDDIALLDAVGKRKHPSAWASQDAEKAQRAKVLLAYEQYVEALRGFAATRKVNDAPGWAAAIIVRHKPTTARSAIGTIFELRDRLISLTDERAVIEIECRLPFKK